MTISAGGSSGIVFPDTTTLPANQITTYLSPGLTDTANVLTANPSAKLVQFNGTTGLTVNGATLTSASSFYPVNTVLPVITGTARDTQTLTVSTGTWTNSPTSYSYQWIRGASTNIGTNSNTYTCVSADIGSTIKCTVTATNGVGTSAGATSLPTSTVVANTYTVTYISVAGGGGGGSTSGGLYGGGGGAGGYLASTYTATGGTVYTVTVGGGGGRNTIGSNSVISGTGLSTITSVGGGFGGCYPNYNGSTGGSGGGGAQGYLGSAGTVGQGGNGGYGGGGGAGGNAGGQNGANGVTSSITGVSATKGGGGGSGDGGNGGTGGGANGANTGGSASPGGVNTGGGGGGESGIDYTKLGSAGGSGVVILSVPTTNYTGTYTGSVVITTNGSNTVMQFNSSGTYTA